MNSAARPATTQNELAGLVYHLRPGPASGPLLVMLHGLGGDEHVMGIFDRSVPEPFSVISPRAQVTIEPGMFPGYTDQGFTWLRSTSAPDRVELDRALDQLRRFILTALDTYHLDRSRVFLMGFSQGAALSYALSLQEPKLIAGVIALAGFLPEDMHPAQRAPDRERRIEGERSRAAVQSKSAFPRHGYLIIHGADDELVPLLRAQQARDFLQALGAPVEYHAYPVGHKVAPPGLKDITQWLNRALAA